MSNLLRCFAFNEFLRIYEIHWMKYILPYLLAGISYFANAQEAFPYKSQIDAIFAAYGNTSPGVSIAIEQNGQLLYSKSYGSANLEWQIPISNKTRFHVASVSKQFTAFAIYLLKEEGLIDLNDDIRKYIPEIPEFGKTIRIRHLLGHTSGLRDQWAMLSNAGWKMEDVITTSQIISMLERQKNLNFDPGSKFLYCNTGYTLLAEMVSRVSGKSFKDFMRENIFDPLGMADTEFCDDMHTVYQNRADSYEKKMDTYFHKKLNYSTVGATSLLTTAEDLAKWTANFTKPKIGALTTLTAFNEWSRLDDGSPVIWDASPGDTTYHAKGQLSYMYKGQKVMSHGGHDVGFRASLTRFPEHKLSIIALSNDEHYNAWGNLTRIADLLLKDVLIEFPAPSANGSQARNKGDTAPKIVPDAGKIVGTYSSEEFMTTYKISSIDGKFYLQHHRLGDMELTPSDRGKMKGNNDFGFEVKFVKMARISLDLKSQILESKMPCSRNKSQVNDIPFIVLH